MARRTIFLSIFLLTAIPALAADEPLFLLNDACVRCHLTGERSGFENSVVAWRGGVHFGPDTGCADCHGGDRYANLSMLKKGHMGKITEGEIAPMCGKCHVTEEEDFLRRPSGAEGANRCKATCATCHGHHRVEKADAAGIINEKNCGACHSFSKARDVAETVAGVEKARASIEKSLAAMRDSGLPTESAEMELARIKKEYARIFHSSTSKTLPGRAQEATIADLGALAASLKGETPSRWRLQGLIVTVFFGLVLYAVIKRFKSLPDISKLKRRKP